MQRDILSIFLASPSDLRDERTLVRSTVERVNRICAKKLGWQIELLGWEDTLPGYSRPQDLINKDVDSSDLFLGILWRRWGLDTGEFDSGFKEEFSRARERRRRTGKPEIWLFFKEIDEDSKKDPGDQLKRVLAFKEEQIKLKELLFKEFKNNDDWARTIHDDLLSYILDLTTLKQEEVMNEQPLNLELAKEENLKKGDKTDNANIIYPPELIELFGNITGNLKNGLQITFDAEQGIRFFLQASAWFSETHLGAVFDNHEINIAYTKRMNWKISESEKWFLIRSVISDKYNLRPGWYWFKDINESDIDNILLWFLENDPNIEVRKGAIKLLADTSFRANRQTITTALTLDDESIILDAVRLIRNTDDIEYLDILEPLIQNENSRIREAAIEIKIELLYLNDPDQGFSLLVESGAKIPYLIHSKLNNLDVHVNSALLLKGLKESEAHIRRFCAEYLRKSETLTRDNFFVLLNDPDPFVKKEGVLGLIELGETIDIDFIKKLFPEQDQGRRGMLGLAINIINADDFIPIILEKHSPESLLKQIYLYNLNSEKAYRILSINHFKILEKRIRTDLDSEFNNLISESKYKLGSTYVDMAKLYEQETLDYIKSKYISAALDGLAIHGKKKDVKYARKYLGNTLYNLADDAAIKMLSRFGDSSDVDKLVETAEKSYGDKQRMAFEAAFKLSKNKSGFLKNLISHENKAISDLSINKILTFNMRNKTEIAKIIINFKDDAKRIKGLSILLQNLSANELEVFLNNYITQQSYYYNVVTWLDKYLYSTGRYKNFFNSQLIQEY